MIRSITLVSLLALSIAADADVIVNEIQYHPASDLSDDEYLELFNTSYASIDVSGWSFAEGIRFTFPPNTIIPPRGFLVVARNKERFLQTYGETPSLLVGDYTKNLSNSGEEIKLIDTTGVQRAQVDYSDDWPWPADADGWGRPLERIDPDSPDDGFRNWLAGRIDFASGTPGTANSVYREGVPPYISAISHTPLVPSPGEEVQITAKIELDGLVSAFLYYNAGTDYAAVPMDLDDSSEEMHGDGTFRATIPGHDAGTLVRYYVEAAATGGAVRAFPSEAPTYGRGWRVSNPSDDSPLVRDELILDSKQLQLFYNLPYELARQTYGSCILDGVLYDAVRIRLRGMASREFPKKNWRIDFPKSHRMNGDTRRINFNSDYHDASHVRNVLSMQFMARLGFPTPQTQHTRMYFNGEYSGVYYRLEHMNDEWLARTGLDPHNEMYETYHDFTLLETPEEYAIRYDKKAGEDEDDFWPLIHFIEGLNAQLPHESRPFLESVFDVDSLLRYMAGRSMLSNKDDFKKNLYIYQNDWVRWELFPHDWDLTWGHAWNPETELLNNDFTTDMNSLDVLSNRLMQVVHYEPTLRAEFYARLKTLVEELLKEEIWSPIIDDYYQKIRQAVYDDTHKWETDQEFDAQIKQLKDYIALRRQYLLEVEIPAESGTPVANWALY